MACQRTGSRLSLIFRLLFRPIRSKDCAFTAPRAAMDGSGMDGPWKWSLTRPGLSPPAPILRSSEAQRLRPDNRGTRTLPGSEPDLIRVGQTKCSRPLPPHCREASPEMEHFLHHAGYGLIELHGGKKRNLGGDHQTLFPSCSDHLYPAFQNQRTCSKVLNKKRFV